jgi:hypothetical protein
VYIWTNLKNGNKNVGSSIDINTRLKCYFKPSVLNLGNRLINKEMRNYGIDNFKLDIYIINTNNIDKSKIRSIVLCLEQYYIFVLNPSLNSIKVAGSNPIVDFTSEHIESIRKANSKKVYLYSDDTLIYEASSATKLREELDLPTSTISYSLKNPSKKIFKLFKVSHILYSDKKKYFK